MNNGLGQNPDAMTTKKVDDKRFLKNAALGGMAEVELGKLAAQKGTSEDVKQFGQKMVDDHSKANDQLKEVAAKAQVEVPSSLDPKHQKALDKLSKLSGEKFDKAYVKNMVKDHNKDVAEFQAEAQNGTDPNVKQFASLARRVAMPNAAARSRPNGCPFRQVVFEFFKVPVAGSMAPGVPTPITAGLTPRDAASSCSTTRRTRPTMWA